MNFKSKLQNFWYYYKNYLLVGALFLMALAIGINSCAQKKPYDLNVLYVTYGYSDSFFQTGELVELFDGYTPDSNSDGKNESQIITINYGNTFKEANSAGAARSANLASGKCVLFLLDQRNYDELSTNGFLEDISDLGDSQFLTKDAFLAFESGILDNVSGFKAIGDPYYLCLRKYDEAKAKSDARFEEQYHTAKQTLINIINEY